MFNVGKKKVRGCVRATELNVSLCLNNNKSSSFVKSVLFSIEFILMFSR